MALTSFWWTSENVGQTNNNKTSTIMIPRIKKMSVLDDYILFVKFDDGYKVLYDVKDDIKTLPSFRALVDVYGLFKQAQLDKPNLCILERQDRYSQRQYLWVWKGSIIKIPVSSFLMIPNRKIPAVGKASYGRDFLDNKRLTLRNIQVYCLL